MNAWQVFKMTAAACDDYADPDVDDVYKLGSVFEYRGEIESRYSTTAPSASDIGNRFGAGVFLLMGPSSYGTSRYVETMHVEAVTEYREAQRDVDVEERAA